MATDNYVKHTSGNPLKKLFIQNFFNNVHEQLKELKIETVLDAGCGEGFTLKRLREWKIGKKFKGIDFSKKAIEIGRKQNPDLSLESGDIYNLKSKDKTFDLVICTEVLEHLEEPEKALRELKRVSKKYILLSVPNEPWFKISNFTQWGKDIGHINEWSSKKFENMVKSQNLKILALKTPFPWTLILVQS